MKDKKTISLRQSLSTAFALALAFLLTACSGNSNMNALLEKLPANSDIVVVGDIKTVVESAGGKVEGSKVQLPESLQDEADRDMKKAIDFLYGSGIDATSCALAYNYEDKYPTFVFAIDKEEDFVKAIKDEDFDKDKEDNGVTYYENESDHAYIAIADGYAYYTIVRYDDNGQKNLRKLIEKAAEEPFAKTPQADYITDGNAVGASIKWPKEMVRLAEVAGVPDELKKLYKGYLCIKSDLQAEEAIVSTKVFDSAGKEIDVTKLSEYMNLESTIDTKALAYLDKDEFLVYAVSLKDVKWDKLLGDAMTSASGMSGTEWAVVKSYLEKFEGTVAMGIGLRDGINSFMKINGGDVVAFKEIPFTAVAQTKPGKATALINDLKELLSREGLEFATTASGISVKKPQSDISINMEAKGDMIILANHEIKETSGNPVVKAIDFSKHIGIVALVLNKDNKLVSDLGLEGGIQILATSNVKTGESTLSLKMEGDKNTGVLSKLIKATMTMSKKYEKAERDYYNAEYNNPDIDYEEADTAASDY